MKKIICLAAFVSLVGCLCYGQTNAEIEFETTTYNFGEFPETDPVVSCTFTFTNTGDAPLVIHQAISSCGCTVPDYTTDPVMPGKKGTVKVTYNGKGKYPGHFKKAVTLRTNAKTEMVRLFIKGYMIPKADLDSEQAQTDSIVTLNQ